MTTTFFEIDSAAVQSALLALPTKVLVHYHNQAAPSKGVLKFENKGKAIKRTTEALLTRGVVVVDEAAMAAGREYSKVFRLRSELEAEAKAAEVARKAAEAKAAADAPPTPVVLPTDVPVGARKLSRYADSNGRPPKPHTKAAWLLKLMLREQGMTEDEGNQVTGWLGCSITAARAAQKAGYEAYSFRRADKVMVYFARVAPTVQQENAA